MDVAADAEALLQNLEGAGGAPAEAQAEIAQADPQQAENVHANGEHEPLRGRKVADGGRRGTAADGAARRRAGTCRMCGHMPANHQGRTGVAAFD